MATTWIGSSPASGGEHVPHRCPACGVPGDDHGERVFRRGAITIASDPTAIWWRGVYVCLSPVEAHVFAFVARRGRVLLTDIDDEMTRFGAKPTTRPVIMGYIRRKFLALGACDPFERLGNRMVRLQVDADETGAIDLVVGLRLPRYARATQQ